MDRQNGFRNESTALQLSRVQLHSQRYVVRKACRGGAGGGVAGLEAKYDRVVQQQNNVNSCSTPPSSKVYWRRPRAVREHGKSIQRDAARCLMISYSTRRSRTALSSDGLH